MKQRRDRNNNPVNTGDLMAEPTAWGCNLMGLSIWRVHGTRDGRGCRYRRDGSRTYFFWANCSAAYKLDESRLPDGFVFSFEHGMDRVYVDQELLKSDIHSAISASDWEKGAMTPSRVANLARIAAINITSLSDVYDNWDDIFGYGEVPYEMMYKIMDVSGVERAVPINGESGLAAMRDWSIFMGLVEVLKKMRDATRDIVDKVQGVMNENHAGN